MKPALLALVVGIMLVTAAIAGAATSSRFTGRQAA